MPKSENGNEEDVIQLYFRRSNSVLSNYDQAFAGDAEARKSRNSVYRLANSAKSEGRYDTDLEDEDDTRTLLEGSRCQKRYMKACRKLKTEPMTFVFWSLDRHTLAIGNRFPTEKENLATAVGIAVNTTLVELRLMHNKLSVKSILYMCAAVWENANISYLEITGNKFCDRSLKIIIDLVKHSQHLSVLILSDNGIRDVQGELVSQLISENKSVMHLNLSYNQLGDQAAMHLGKVLEDDEILQELNLSWNCIRTRGAELLCLGLKKNIVLTVLNLRMNGVGTDGAGYFSRLLMENTVLLEVDLSQNRIYDRGYGYLAKMVLKNQRLSRLAIGNNPVSTVGIKVFLQALLKSKNSSISEVELDGVYISKEMEELVGALKDMNPNLKIEVHGVVNKDTDTPEKEDPKKGVIQMHPLEILRFYIEKTGSRLIDVFRMFDRQHRNEVSKEDFVKGLEILNIPLTTAQVEDLMSILDTTNSGLISFGDMVVGDKEARARLRQRKEKIRKQSEIPRPNFDDLK